MLDLNDIAVDPKKSVKGTWVDILGAKFKVARFNNRDAEAARAAALSSLYEELKKAGEDEKKAQATEEKWKKAQAQVMADYVLLDWKGIGQGGKELKYSKKKAVELLSDPRYEDVFQAVFRASLSHENFAAANEEAIKKDVKTTSSS